MIIHRPNIVAITQEAERIKAQEETGGSQRRDLIWFNFEPDHRAADIKTKIRSAGQNGLIATSTFFLAPPWSPEGMIARTVHKHKMFLSNTTHKCLAATWPKLGKVCNICVAISEINAQYPGVDISSCMAYAQSTVQIYAPEQHSNLVQMATISAKVHNWLIMQLADPRFSPPDNPATNPFDAVLFKVMKKLTLRSDGDVQVNYETGNYPARMPWVRDASGAAHEPTINQLVESMFDLDKVMAKDPDDKLLLEVFQAAEQLKNWAKGKSGGVMAQVPPAMQQPQTTQAPPMNPLMAHPGPAAIPFTPPGGAAPAATQGQFVPPATTVSQPAPFAPPGAAAPTNPAVGAVPISAAPMTAPAAPAAVPFVPPGAPAPQMAPPVLSPAANPVPTQLPVVQSSRPAGAPDCWGGQANRPDGGLGNQRGNKICMMCTEEFSCMDQCKKIGIVNDPAT